MQRILITQDEIMRVETHMLGVGIEKTFHNGRRWKKVIPILFQGLQQALAHPRILCDLS